MAAPTTESESSVTISIPPSSAAEDEPFVSTLTSVLNAVYTEAEQGIFVAGYRRTNEPEVAGLLRAGQLAVAYCGYRPIGCVLVKQLSPERGDMAMLALDPSWRGVGTGRQLVHFCEAYCRSLGCTLMQLELLFPTTFTHPWKQRLHLWYVKMGYQVVEIGDFNKDYPQLNPLLAGPAEYRIFGKSLI